MNRREYLLNRKRKRNSLFNGSYHTSIHTHSQKANKSEGRINDKALYLPQHLFRSLDKVKIVELQDEDSTSRETGSMISKVSSCFKTISNYCIGYIIRPKHIEEVDDLSKKRKIDESRGNPYNEKKIQSKLNNEKPDRTALSKKALLANLQPQLHIESKDVNFVRSPIADWDFTDHGKKTSESDKKDYGLNFIKRKNKSYKPTKTAQHLRSTFKGDYQSPKPKDTRPPSPASFKNQDNKSIHSLMEHTKRNWPVPRKELPDDLVIIKEVKLPQTPSKFSLIFKHPALTFDKDYEEYQKVYQKNYQELVNKRKLQSEKISKEISEARKPVSQLIPKLSEVKENEVVNIWKSRGKDNQVLLDALNIEVTVKDFKTLADKQWLNDVVIELYLKTLITPKTYAFNSFMFATMQNKGYQGVQKWMKRAKVQISKLDLILCPINVHQTHWVLGAIDLKNKKIIYLDSLATRTNSFSLAALDILEEFVKGETKKQGVPQLGQGFTKEQILDCPQQQNGYDCGVFTLLNSFYLSKNSDLTYQPSEAKNFRRVIASTILDLAK